MNSYPRASSMASNICSSNHTVNVFNLLESFTERIVEKQKSVDLTRLDQVMDLEHAIEDMLRYIRKIHNNLIPVHKMPPEILCSIFNFALDPQKMDYTAGAFTFSHVSQRWRATALSYRPLWSHITLATRGLHAHETCLERSGNAPLTVVIRPPRINRDPSSDAHQFGGLSEPDYDYLQKKIYPALNILCDHHHNRIHTLDIQASAEWEAVLEEIDFPLPNLRHLKCHFTGAYLRQAAGIYGKAFGAQFPNRLQTLILVNVSMNSLESFNGPFDNLKVLKIVTEYDQSMHATLFLDFLRKCPQLEALTVKGYSMLNVPLDALVNLHRLNELSFNHTNVRDILQCIDCPDVVRFKSTDALSSAYENKMRFSFPPDLSRLSFLRNFTSLLITEDPYCISMTLKSADYHTYERLCYVHVDTGILYPRDDEFCIHTLTFVSDLSLSLVTALTIDRTECQVLPTAYVAEDLMRDVYRSLPSLLSLAIMDDRGNELLPSLIHRTGPLICPELNSITVLITKDYWEDVFNDIHSIVTSRAEAGKSLNIAHITKSNGTHLTPLWMTLCDAHNIKTFNDENAFIGFEERRRAR